MKKNNIFRKVLLMASAAMLAVSSMGCGSTAGSDGTQTSGDTTTEAAVISKEKTDEVLRVATATLPTTLDANASVSNAGIQVYYNIYDTLIMRDTNICSGTCRKLGTDRRTGMGV